jgi:hypothetical protein
MAPLDKVVTNQHCQFSGRLDYYKRPTSVLWTSVTAIRPGIEPMIPAIAAGDVPYDDGCLTNQERRAYRFVNYSFWGTVSTFYHAACFE